MARLLARSWITGGLVVFAAGVTVAAMLVPVSVARAQENSIRADFNGDGIGDLAIGLPHEDVGSIPDAGAVSVIYGSLSGLAALGNQLWTQDAAMGTSEAGDFFGWALASGDFDGDGIDDLAIGTPLEDITLPPIPVPTPGPAPDAGAVNVLYGSNKLGLTTAGQQFIFQGQSLHGGLVGGNLEAGDRFGSALAAGDFGRHAKGFGADDLAIGVPFEDLEPFPFIADAGAVNVLYGSGFFLTRGLSAAADNLWHQCVLTITGSCRGGGLADGAQQGDGFGSSLAAANFGLDGQDDLAVGVHFEDVGSATGAGAVNVIYGSSVRGLTRDGNQVLTQNSLVNESGDASEEGDLFGWSLAGGDLNGDGFAELASGAPSEDVGAEANAGAVDVIYGSATGLSIMVTQFWTQNDAGGASEAGDNFGWSLAIGDFGTSGHGDLAIGAPFETLQELQAPIVAAGGVNVMYGSADGVTGTGAQFVSQDTLNVPDEAEREDLFGFALAAVDFGNAAQSDLAIGILQEDTPVGNAGAVDVLYGTDVGLVGLTDPGNQLWHQDSPGILDESEVDDQYGEVLINGSVGRHALIFD